VIRYVYADQLSQYPVLADSMYRDRAAQFKDRLDWEVTVDENGWEIDEYDLLNPLYIIWQDANGRHGGSVRPPAASLPTSTSSTSPAASGLRAR
jgi:acyl homoserine lactone synthase